MIEFKNVEISYGDFVAISNLNLDIKEGEFFTFLGQSSININWNQIPSNVEVYALALKENNENLIHECYVGKEKYYFTQEEVYYLEAEGSYTHIHLKEQRYMISERLKLWEEKLKSAPMVRIHKSYLINMLHVKSWENDSVVLTNGTLLPQGRQYRKDAKEAYLKFIGEMARGRM